MTHPDFDPLLAPLLAPLAGYVPLKMTLEQLEHFRRLSDVTREALIGDAQVDCVDHTLRGYQGADIVCSVISRKGHSVAGPAVYHIHGGGMVMGTRFAGARPLVDWALRHDAVCVSVEYRRAPEHPAPALVEDCYAGLEWMAANAKLLRFNPNQLVIFGGSGGGGLAAGTTLLAQDRQGPRLLGQLLQCPMLDDRNETASAHRYDGVGVWDRTSNLTAWRAVLGDRLGGPDVSPYSAPARASDLSRLPPTFIDVGGAETFRDEAVTYATRILAAGGECELHVWGGAFHGFHDIAPQSALAQACIAARDSWLARMFARDATHPVTR
ncbi:alpha/beta hydrolase [Myxococcus fulvus]|uniref:alpha/beta hydrolase n=1 Tax=Myxococcus fulvus TaxID=33 RepID=UPI003B99E3F6